LTTSTPPVLRLQQNRAHLDVCLCLVPSALTTAASRLPSSGRRVDALHRHGNHRTCCGQRAQAMAASDAHLGERESPGHARMCLTRPAKITFMQVGTSCDAHMSNRQAPLVGSGPLVHVRQSRYSAVRIERIPAIAGSSREPLERSSFAPV
jgi:hypothetical protein